MSDAAVELLAPTALMRVVLDAKYALGSRLLLFVEFVAFLLVMCCYARLTTFDALGFSATWLLPGGEARVAAAARGFEAFIVQLRRRSLERPVPPPRPRPRLDASPVHREADGDAALTYFADGRARLVSDAPPVVLEVDAASATLKVLLEGEAFEAPAMRPPRGLGPLAARLVDFRFLSSLSPDDRRHELATRRRREAAIRGAAASAGAMAVGLKGAPPPPPPRAPAPPAAPFTPPSRRGPAAAPATARVHAALRSTSDFLADLRAR